MGNVVVAGAENMQKTSQGPVTGTGEHPKAALKGSKAVIHEAWKKRIPGNSPAPQKFVHQPRTGQSQWKGQCVAWTMTAGCSHKKESEDLLFHDDQQET